jgi:hypothetical protein
LYAPLNTKFVGIQGHDNVQIRHNIVMEFFTTTNTKTFFMKRRNPGQYFFFFSLSNSEVPPLLFIPPISLSPTHHGAIYVTWFLQFLHFGGSS